MGESKLVTTGPITSLAAAVSRHLGRKVVVQHSRYMFRPTGSVKMKWSPWRYTIIFEGVQIPFADLTINEAKGRLAMLSDLYYHGVFDDCNSKARSGRVQPPAGGAGEPAQTADLGAERGAQGGVHLVNQPSGSDDRY